MAPSVFRSAATLKLLRPLKIQSVVARNATMAYTTHTSVDISQLGSAVTYKVWPYSSCYRLPLVWHKGMNT
jgi:hypothetical protein